jgi:3-deoxy-manno-octulosonate cytidylyltransferase (CMP-KDO synthetase)
MRVLGVIPARLGSTRIPHKPLQLLAGEPLVTRVIQRVRDLGLVDELVVATDSTMVVRVVELAGARAVLTRETHQSGTERVAEVAGRPEFSAWEVVANIQGDEPFLPDAALAGALERVAQGDEVGTAAAPLAAEQAGDPDRVKVVVDAQGRALYFSRAAIPFRRERTPAPQDLYWQHVGVYAYQRDTLQRWACLPPVPAEESERLEQLRALHYGMRVGVAHLDEPVQPGVDTPEDLRRAEAHWLALEVPR